ncbi:MAG: lytic murein transglycosylase [Hyphomicrobium sp.]
MKRAKTSFARLALALAVAVPTLASPLAPTYAQGIFDDFFGPPPKKKPRRQPAKQPAAVNQPAPVQNAAPVQQPGNVKVSPAGPKAQTPPASAQPAAKPATPAQPAVAKTEPAVSPAAAPAKPAVAQPPVGTPVTPKVPPTAALPKPATPPPAATTAAPAATAAPAKPAPPASPPTAALPQAATPAAPSSAAAKVPPVAAKPAANATEAVVPAVVAPLVVAPIVAAPAAAPPVTAAPARSTPTLPAPAAVQPQKPAADPSPEVATITPPPAPATPPSPVRTSLHKMPPPPKPANCRNSGNFSGWLAEFRKEASAAGVSKGTISDVLDGMTLDQGIINRDRGGQKVFSMSFVDFSDKLANPGRIRNSIAKLAKHKALFARAEAEYGVPGTVITAFWALESDFGSGMGNLPILRSLATLAYDCRRGEMFREELLAALKLVDRGDMRQEEMVGSWAGEIGQTQFLPGHVLTYAVDYDGDGKSDLFRNNADIIGTSANFVRDLGWVAGQPWLREVRLTTNLPWQEADLAIKHPSSQWIEWGVKAANGAPLDEGDPPASLLLPMGRFGPAFLAYPNFDVYPKWNQSLVYTLTAAYLATRVAGAPPMSRGQPGIPMLSAAEVKELQILLNARGWQVGEPDGKLGAGTRAMVKQAQLKLKFPADSYPTPELVAALRNSR